MREALEQVGAEKGDRVVFLVDGPLSLSPLGLLQGDAAGRPLMEDYEVTISPNARALAQSLDRAASPVEARLAFVAGDQTSEPPILANAELQLVSVLLGPSRPADVMVGAELSERGADSLGNSTYWHFASHGVFIPCDPYASGLVLTGEGARAPRAWTCEGAPEPQLAPTLTVQELQKTAARVAPPRLVFLSGCETALVDTEGAGDEFVGLPGAFIGANATGVVGSVWPSDDTATTLITTRFYRNHLVEGMRPSAALREAQLWVRDMTMDDFVHFVSAQREAGAITDDDAELFRSSVEGMDPERPFADPYYWGGWVLYGQ